MKGKPVWELYLEAKSLAVEFPEAVLLVLICTQGRDLVSWKEEDSISGDSEAVVAVNEVRRGQSEYVGKSTVYFVYI